MKKIFSVVSALCISLCCRGGAEAQRDFRSFEVERGVLSVSSGHVQGFCFGEDAIYVSQMKQITKFDWNGKFIKKVSVPSHTGDICYWDGHIYTAVVLYQGPDRGKGVIQVYDADLNFVREKKLKRGTDGITCLDGVIYIGMGANHVPSKKAHRENFFGRFNAKTLEQIGEKHTVDYGYKTHYGAQCMSNDGKNILVAFYGAEKGMPSVVEFDREFKPVKLVKGFGAAEGIDLVPKRMRGDRLVYARTYTVYENTSDGSGKRPVVGCSLSFHEYKNGKMTAVKK